MVCIGYLIDMSTKLVLWAQTSTLSKVIRQIINGWYTNKYNTCQNHGNTYIYNGFYHTFSVCGFVYMFIIGSVKSFGVVYTELLDHYDTGAGSTAWISSLSFLLLMGLGKFIAAQANYNTSNLVVVMSEKQIKLLWITRIFELTIIKYTLHVLRY